MGLKFFATDSIEYLKLSTPSDISINESFLRLYADGNNIILIGFRQMYVFDRMSGQLKHEIGTVGRGPEEYEKTLHYNAYDEKRKVITAGKQGSQSLIEYNINGGVVNEINFTQQVGDVVTHFDDDIYVTYMQNWFGNNMPRIKLLNELSKEINIFYHHIKLESEPKRSGTKKGKFYKFDERLMFFEEYLDTLYQITKDKMVPRYYLSMGQFAPKYMDQFDLNYRKSGRMDGNIHMVVMFESARYIFMRYVYNQYWYWHAVYDKDLNIIVDNYSTHKHEKLQKWLKRNKRVFLHFTPTSSSWLNLVERFFGVLTEKQLKRGVFTSIDELEQIIIAHIDKNNKNPKPFVWTKSAEEILEKVNRARLTLDNIQSN